MIQGWNQSVQQALGTIRLRLMIEDMMTYVTFHVIDAITSTNVLLGRLWLHEHKALNRSLFNRIKASVLEVQDSRRRKENEED